MTKLDTELTRLHGSEITWEEFVRLTHREWEALAGSLKQRWGQDCAAVDVDDLAQDLLLAAWPALSQWDPSRGVPLKAYVVFQAMSQAKRGLHKMRGANLHRPDGEPSRTPIAESAMLRPGDDQRDDGFIAGYSAGGPEQDVAARARDALTFAGPHGAVVRALLRGDLDRATRLARGRGRARLGKRDALNKVRGIASAVLAQMEG